MLSNSFRVVIFRVVMLIVVLVCCVEHWFRGVRRTNPAPFAREAKVEWMAWLTRSAVPSTRVPGMDVRSRNRDTLYAEPCGQPARASHERRCSLMLEVPGAHPFLPLDVLTPDCPSSPAMVKTGPMCQAGPKPPGISYAAILVLR